MYAHEWRKTREQAEDDGPFCFCGHTAGSHTMRPNTLPTLSVAATVGYCYGCESFGHETDPLHEYEEVR